MRFFYDTLSTDIYTFSPLPTSIEAHRKGVFLRPGEHPADTPLMCTALLWVARRQAVAEGFTLVRATALRPAQQG